MQYGCIPAFPWGKGAALEKYYFVGAGALDRPPRRRRGLPMNHITLSQNRASPSGPARAATVIRPDTTNGGGHPAVSDIIEDLLPKENEERHYGTH
jgi:hypothetical protein